MSQPQIPAPDPATEGIDAVCTKLAAILSEELVVDDFSPTNGTLRTAFDTPPTTIAGKVPCAIIRAYSGKYGRGGFGVMQTEHIISVTIYSAVFNTTTPKGSVESKTRRYSVTVPQAIYKHLGLGGGSIDLGSSEFKVNVVQYDLGLGTYAGYSGAGVSTPEDTTIYSTCQFILFAQEKELMNYGL